MSTAEQILRKNKIVPWAVGAEDAVCVVGVQGTITALDREAGTITIAGHTLPTALGNGVRLLSMTFSGADDGDCAEEHLDDHECKDEDTQNTLDDLVDTITGEHYMRHDGAFRFCPNVVCAAVAGAS